MINEPEEPIILLKTPPKRYAVVRSWRTSTTPAPAYMSYHLECWDDPSITPGPVEQPYKENGAVRLVPLAEMAIWATCVKCGQALVTMVS